MKNNVFLRFELARPRISIPGVQVVEDVVLVVGAAEEGGGVFRQLGDQRLRGQVAHVVERQLRGPSLPLPLVDIFLQVAEPLRQQGLPVLVLKGRA